MPQNYLPKHECVFILKRHTNMMGQNKVICTEREYHLRPLCLKRKVNQRTCVTKFFQPVEYVTVSTRIPKTWPHPQVPIGCQLGCKGGKTGNAGVGQSHNAKQIVQNQGGGHLGTRQPKIFCFTCLSIVTQLSQNFIIKWIL